MLKPDSHSRILGKFNRILDIRISDEGYRKYFTIELIAWLDKKSELGRSLRCLGRLLSASKTEICEYHNLKRKL